MAHLASERVTGLESTDGSSTPASGKTPSRFGQEKSDVGDDCGGGGGGSPRQAPDLPICAVA